MSDTESLDYLQPGFDAKTLTMPRLRSILVSHNVQYPSTAKKSQLVETFNDYVVPQAKRILDQRARAKRSSRGIIDAESSQDSHSQPFDDDSEELPPPPPQPQPRRTPRQPSIAPPVTTAASTRARRSQSPRKVSSTTSPEKKSEPTRAPASIRSASKRNTSATSRHRQVSDSDTGGEPDGGGLPAFNRSRSSQKKLPPQLKAENSADTFFRRESGAFSSENPFQSGSSPLGVPSERASSSRRRTTAAGHSSTSRPTSSHSVRRQTDGQQVFNGQRRISSRPARYDSPQISDEEGDSSGNEYEDEAQAVIDPGRGNFVQHEEVYTPNIEAGEEFTPQEQLELAAEEVTQAIQTKRPKRTDLIRHDPTPASSSRTTSLCVMLVAILSIYAAWYRQETMAIGYCGVGRSVGSIPAEIPVPEWAQAVLPPELSVPQAVADFLEPSCQSCPSHAYCYDDFTVRCEQDYILKPHPLSVGGLAPLPPTCEPDGEKVRRVRAVADRAVEELRERTAKYECGEPVHGQGRVADSAAVEEQKLKEIINEKRNKKMSDREFEDLWSSAIGEIKARDEVQVKQDEGADGAREYLTSTSLARVPLPCAARRAVRLGVARYRLQISLVISVILTALYARWSYRANRAATAQVPALVDLVLSRLAAQKELGLDDLDDPWLFLPNLRDDVLRSTHSLAKREKIWQRVRAVVEQNSNVRTSQREGRSGEVGRAWEWIGPMDGDGARRRRSGRVSWGTANGAKVKTEDLSADDADRSLLHQKWQEGAPPVY